MLVDQQSSPVLDCGPCLRAELRERIRCYCSAGSGTGRHDPVDNPGTFHGFPDTVTRYNDQADRRYWMHSVKIADLYLSAEFNQCLALPLVRAVMLLKHSGLPPGIGPHDKAERISIEPGDIIR